MITRRSPMGKQTRGFTLLEVMVALAILSIALAVIVQANTRNATSSNHARQMTSASFLARAALVQLEDDLDQNGFPALEDTRSGNFSDDGYPGFRWEAKIEKIEIPSNLPEVAQKAATEKQTDAVNKAGESLGGFAPTTGQMGGAASVVMSQFEIIRSALEQSIRKVTLKIFWIEGRTEKSIEVATFLTDPQQVDFALPGISALPAGGGAPVGQPAGNRPPGSAAPAAPGQPAPAQPTPPFIGGNR